MSWRIQAQETLVFNVADRGSEYSRGPNRALQTPYTPLAAAGFGLVAIDKIRKLEGL